jgi:hypothetical protein
LTYSLRYDWPSARAEEAAKKAGGKGVEGVKTAGSARAKVKEAGEKGVDETKKAVQKAKEKNRLTSVFHL